MNKVLVKNFTPERDGHQIEAIVLHITAGSVASTLSWFNNPRSYASAHFLVSPTAPHVIQLVETFNTAWHAGRVVRPTWKGLKELSPNTLGSVNIPSEDLGEKGPPFTVLETDKLGGQRVVANPNLYTIGIEVALPNGKILPNWNQWIATARLVKELCEEYHIPKDYDHIVGHNMIRADKECPGSWVTPFYKLALMRFV